MYRRWILLIGMIGITTSLLGASFSEILIENDPTPPKKVKILMRETENKDMTEEELALFINKLTNIYIEEGYVTSFVSLHTASLEEGKLELSLNRGYVDQILVDDTSPFLLPVKSGDVLNMRDLDQIVENLRTPLTETRVTLIPSEKKRYSNIKIQRERTKMLEGSFTLNNDNDKDYGRENILLSLGRDDLLFSGDMLTVSWKERLTKERKSNRNRKYQFSYSLPVKTLKLQYQFSQEENRVGVLENKYQSKEIKDIHRVEVSKIIERNSRQKWEAYMYANIQKNKSYFGGIKLDVSSKTYSSLGVGLRNLFFIPNGYFYTEIGLEKGVPFWGAEKDEKEAKTPEPFRREFTKGVFQLQGNKSFFITKYGDWNYAFLLSAVYSKDHLLDMNKFEMGGIDSVRGFKESTIKGDKGVYLRNTLSFRGKHWKPFIGLDYGISRDYYRDSSDKILGMAAGVEYNYSDFSAELTFSKALHYAKDMPKETPPIYFKLSYKF